MIESTKKSAHNFGELHGLRFERECFKPFCAFIIANICS